MTLLAIAIAPGIAIMWYIYAKDKYDREPKRHIIISFFLGMLATIPAIIVQATVTTLFGDFRNSTSVAYYAFYAFAIVAASEELSKYLMLRVYAYRQKEFNEPFDGIVYSVMVAMGFATLENIGYVYQYGMGTGITRMFLSVPAHASFGVLMGYYVGLAKFNKGGSAALTFKGLLLAILFHGAFDFFLFLQGNAKVTAYISEGLLFLGALISYLIAIRLSLRSIKLHQQLSKTHFENNPNNV
jgi:protease PrsW